MTQPGVFWMLRAAFADVIGLYFNVAENSGFICGRAPGIAQKSGSSPGSKKRWRNE